MSEQVSEKPSTSGFFIKYFLRIVFYIGLLAIVLFLAAGTLNWLMAWVYFGTWLLMVVVGMLFIFPDNQDLAAERASPGENAKSWDKYYVLFLVLLGPILVELVAGLDYRNGWTQGLPRWLQIISLLPWIMISGLTVWSMRTNRFFSSVVRIQEDRGHQVITDGPYRFVRHPGYTGGVASALLIPLILGSFWAYIPTLLIIFVYVMRILREEETLRAELAGYEAYTNQVRYRLIPGIW